MTSKIRIWCPHCHKRYQIPEGLGSKKLHCKKCSNSFPANQAFTSDPDAPALMAELIEEPQEPQSSAPRQPKEDISSFFKNPEALGMPPAGSSAAAMPTATAQPGSIGPASENVRHVSNPMMIPAVIGAVLFSLLMCGVALGYSWIQSLVPLANNANAPVNIPRPNEAVSGVQPNSTRGAGAIAHADGDHPGDSELKQSDDFARIEAEAVARRKRDADRTARLEADKARAAERRAADEIEAKKRKAEREARELARETKKIERLAKEKEARLADSPDETPTENLLLRVRLGTFGVNAAVSTDKFLITGQYDVVRVFDWTNQSEVFEILELDQKFRRVTAIAVSPDFQRVAIGGSNGAIGIYQLLDSGELLAPKEFLVGQKNDITKMIFNQDATRLVSANRWEDVFLWDVATSKSIKQIQLPRSTARSTAMAAVENKFHVTDGNETEIYSFESGEKTGARSTGLRHARAVAVSPSGDLLAVLKGGEITIFDRKGRELNKFRTEGGLVHAVGFLDEKTLLSDSRNQVNKWNVKKGKVINEFVIPDIASSIRFLVVSPEGKHIIASGNSRRRDVFLIDVSE